MIFALPFALEEEDDDRLLLMRYCRLVASAMLEEEEEAPQAAVEQAIIGSTRVVAIATRGSLHERLAASREVPSRNERAERSRSYYLSSDFRCLHALVPGSRAAAPG